MTLFNCSSQLAPQVGERSNLQHQARLKWFHNGYSLPFPFPVPTQAQRCSPGVHVERFFLLLSRFGVRTADVELYIGETPYSTISVMPGRLSSSAMSNCSAPKLEKVERLAVLGGSRVRMAEGELRDI